MWYLTNLDPKLSLEFSTLDSQGGQSASSLAQSLGRLRGSTILQELSKIVGTTCFLSLGIDGHLYLSSDKHPLINLGEKEQGILAVTEQTTRPPVKEELRKALDQAKDAIRQDRLITQISGLLRHQMIDDGILELGNRKPYTVAFSPQDYLKFLAEADVGVFRATDKYPLLEKGVMGTYKNLIIIKNIMVDTNQVYIVADDGSTVVLNIS